MTAAVPLPPSPIGNTNRLKALRLLKIDDHDLEASLQTVVETVGQLFEARCCMINLVYEQRQIMKSWVGPLPDTLAREGNPNENSFCTYVVEAGAPLVISDLSDEHLWQEPFDFPQRLLEFYRAFGVRFYAGLPLIDTGGNALGTLCLVDTEPRTITASALEALQFFAAKATAELELSSQVRKSQRVADDLAATSRYASALSDLVVRAQTITDPRAGFEIILTRLKDTLNLHWTALIDGSQGARVVAHSGEVPAGVERLFDTLTRDDPSVEQAYERLTLPAVPGLIAAISLPAPTASRILVCGRDESAGWSHPQRFLLDGAARLLGTVLQRSSQVTTLQRAALTDELTGLGNRRAFEELASRPLDPNEHLVLFLGDLAGFKLLNDSMGHPVGDLCLRRVGEALLRCVRPDDRGGVIRYGGDEFVLVLPAREEAIPSLTARLQSAVSTALREYENIRLHLHLGAASIPREASSIKEALRIADQRMYEGKRVHVQEMLSDRELQVMHMLIDGKRPKEIAMELGVTETTIATHRSRFMSKLNLRDNRDLFRYALRTGLLI